MTMNILVGKLTKAECEACIPLLKAGMPKVEWKAWETPNGFSLYTDKKLSMKLVSQACGIVKPVLNPAS